MSSEDARSVVITAANAFGIGDATIQEMWAALHANLQDLCRDAPLTGDYLDLFNALERWESSAGPKRRDEISSARAIARRLDESA